MTTDQELPPPPVPPAPLESPRRPGRFTSEVMAGGSVVEKDDDELVGGLRGALGVLGVVALIGVLGLFNIWWLVFVVGVLISIFLHETGHFVTARWTGMKATQFFIGFGPRLWSFRKGETEYGVRALPLGAFVRIIGMNNMDDVPPEDESRTYRSKSYPRRLLVISAGSLMHMLIAIVLLFTVYVVDGEVTPTDGVEVRELVVASPALAAGLRVDDVMLSIDGTELSDPEQLGEVVQAGQPGDVLIVEVVRDGATIDVPVVLAANDRSGIAAVRQALHRGGQHRSVRNRRTLGTRRRRQRRRRHLPDLVGDDQGRRQGPQSGQHLHPPGGHQRRSRDPADDPGRASPASATTSATRQGSSASCTCWRC